MIGRALICLAALLWPNLVSAACLVRQRAEVPLEIAGTVVLAPVMVNGIPGTFILDTGAAQTVVTPEAVSHFGLALDEWTATTMRGVGGIERRRNADPRSVELGGVALHRRSLARDATLRVMTLPRNILGGRRIDGLLGRDFLSLFDIDLDFSRRMLTLYDVHDCVGQFLPWTEAYLSVPVENPAESALLVPVALDGVPLRALLIRVPATHWSRRRAWPALAWVLNACAATRARSSAAWGHTRSPCGNTGSATFGSAARRSPDPRFLSHPSNFNRSATCYWARTG